MKRCGFGVQLDDLSQRDWEEVEKFSAWLGIEKSRRAGGEPGTLNMLEQALYPDGIGRPPIDGALEA